MRSNPDSKSYKAGQRFGLILAILVAVAVVSVVAVGAVKLVAFVWGL